MRVVDRFAVVLRALSDYARERGVGEYMSNADLQEATDLPADDLNEIVELLVDRGDVEWLRAMGTAPYVFGHARSTARGRFELRQHTDDVRQHRDTALPPPPPVNPVGSPYGFTDQDWEWVNARKGDPERLLVVLGLQFESAHYNADALKENVEGMFANALREYQDAATALPAELEFSPLQAGYGEHLFNEIARDIISADIAVFEASDLNPNVMIEMGVALTWGVRVLPIKLRGRPRPPSDISGQTWADYEADAATFADPDHHAKLVRMVERAIRKKARR